MGQETLTLTGSEGPNTFTKVEDPTNPMVGTWVAQVADENPFFITILSSGFYYEAEDGTPEQTGFPGVEIGHLSWDRNTNVVTRTVFVDTNGTWGLSTHATATVSFDGVNTMTLDNGEGPFTLVRLDSITNPIIGGWYLAHPHGTAVVAFLPNGEYWFAEDLDNSDPNAQDGMEHGTYTWNPGTHAFTSVTVTNTDLEGGLSHAGIFQAVAAGAGLPGDDTLAGGSANDTLSGGGGNDSIDGGSGDDILYGDEGNDRLSGDDGNDYLDGGTGNDSMEGGAGNDTYVVDSNGDTVTEPDSLPNPGASAAPAQVAIGGGIDTVIASIDYTLGTFIENLTLSGNGALNGGGNAAANVITGNAGRNHLTGNAGNDSIDGGAGVDTALYAGSRGDYTVLKAGAQWTVTSSAEGVDTLSNVERLHFGDTNLALDLDGKAGEVAKILGAVFGASFAHNATYVGLGLQYADGGMSYEVLMQLALNVRLGGAQTNAQVVELLYTNVVGTVPGPNEIASFTAMIDSGQYTQASLGVLAANTGLNLEHIGFTTLTTNGLEYY